MVGLSVILENYRDLYEKGRNCGVAATTHQVISKGSMIKPPSPTLPASPSSVFSRSKTAPSYVAGCGFLEHCFLCKQKLLPSKDIYMYNGDKAFCSVECRCRQILMDEEELTAAKKGRTREYNCSLAATSSTVPSASSSSSSSSSCGGNKGPRNNRAITNAFAY